MDDRDSNVDPHYVDDFLLTYRVFIHNPTIIFEKLMMWFADGALRDKVLSRNSCDAFYRGQPSMRSFRFVREPVRRLSSYLHL